MRISPSIHCLRIDFQVTPELKRFVHIFLITGKSIYMVDAGVAGAEQAVSDYLESIGRKMEDVSKLFLTHSHPDHIGGAAAIKRLSNCQVFASAAEREWIENIERQFKDRPIPNFHNLLNESVEIDEFTSGGDVIACEEGISLEIIDTPGHSHGSQCLLFKEEGALFSGDAIPVPGDIPIYVNAGQTRTSLHKILSLNDINLYLSAWDKPLDSEGGKNALSMALKKQEEIENAVVHVLSSLPEADPSTQFEEVCRLLNLEHLRENPLFRKSVSIHLEELKSNS